MAESSRTAPPNSCSGCGATWTGAGPAHCAAPNCHLTFASAGLFDKHREATRGIADHGRCLDPATVRNNGQRIMFFREGMWRGPVATEADRARMGWRK